MNRMTSTEAALEMSQTEKMNGNNARNVAPDVPNENEHETNDLETEDLEARDIESNVLENNDLGTSDLEGDGLATDFGSSGFGSRGRRPTVPPENHNPEAHVLDLLIVLSRQKRIIRFPNTLYPGPAREFTTSRRLLCLNRLGYPGLRLTAAWQPARS